MLITIDTACKNLLAQDNILIFAHQKPDGDTLGGTFALMWALQKLGKKARVVCTDEFPKRYDFLYGDYEPDTSFEPEYVVALDIADVSLIGDRDTPYADRIDLCIDHHKSNSGYAKQVLLRLEAPAVCEIVYDVILGMGVTIDKHIANALFTGLTTDTGCFKYASTTSKTHIVAAKLIEYGADHGKINKLMFDSKTRGMLMVERMMIETTTFYFHDHCAMAVIPADVSEKFGVGEDDLDGISAFTARIEGVMVGVTIRAKADSTYRVSVRTSSPVDASKICSMFGGGGHMNAAGCTLYGELYSVIDSLLVAVEDELKRHGIS